MTFKRRLRRRDRGRGHAAVGQLAIDIARRGGRVVLTGMPGDYADGISRQKLVTQAVTVFNVFGAPSRAWVHTVRAFAAGLLDPDAADHPRAAAERDPGGVSPDDL